MATVTPEGVRPFLREGRTVAKPPSQEETLVTTRTPNLVRDMETEAKAKERTPIPSPQASATRRRPSLPPSLHILNAEQFPMPAETPQEMGGTLDHIRAASGSSKAAERRQKSGRAESIHPALAASDALKLIAKNKVSEQEKETLAVRGVSSKLRRANEVDAAAQVWTPESAVAGEESEASSGLKKPLGFEDWRREDRESENGEEEIGLEREGGEGSEEEEEEEEVEDGEEDESLVQLLYSEVTEGLGEQDRDQPAATMVKRRSAATYGENSILLPPPEEKDIKRAGEFRGLLNYMYCRVFSN